MSEGARKTDAVVELGGQLGGTVGIVAPVEGVAQPKLSFVIQPPALDCRVILRQMHGGDH